MNNLIRPLVASFALGALAACGGSGSGSGISADGRQYNSLVDEYNGYRKKYNIPSNASPLEINGTPLAEMPTSGRAVYKGVGHVDATFAPDASLENKALGTARLTADFRKGNLTGNVTDFKTNRGNATSGQLSVNSNITGSKIFGRTTGSVVLGGQTHRIDHRNTGTFLGKNANGIAITSTDRTSPFAPPGINTVILGERQ